MGTIVARPGVADATPKIERGFFGHQQNAAAARAFGSAKIVRHGLRGVASELDGHRRSSATFPHTPRSVPILRNSEWTLWRRYDANMKLSWPLAAIFRSNTEER